MQLDYLLELPNDLKAIERSVDYLVDRAREAGFEDDRLRLNFRVGLTEALANAMLYGNCHDPRKRVRIEASLSRDELAVQVTDEGCGFNPASILDPTLPANRQLPCGRGLFLIRNLMDRVEFNERGNSIRMVLLRQPAVPGERASGP
ncbi:MAG: ATP-binding protein [Gemmatimonadetes bacterium]|nr:ATP-binding protein [Gemmatimonadota bacterium]